MRKPLNPPGEQSDASGSAVDVDWLAAGEKAVLFFCPPITYPAGDWTLSW